jgi:hypothetical protein
VFSFPYETRMQGTHLSVCSAIWGHMLVFALVCTTSNDVMDDSSTLHCKKWSTNVCNIIIVVVLRFFEYLYIVEILGLWGYRLYGRVDDISRGL